MLDTSQRHRSAGASVRHRATGQTGVIIGQLLTRSRENGAVVSVEVFVRPHGGGIEWSAAPADLESYQDIGTPDAA